MLHLGSGGKCIVGKLKVTVKSCTHAVMNIVNHDRRSVTSQPVQLKVQLKRSSHFMAQIDTFTGCSLGTVLPRTEAHLELQHMGVYSSACIASFDKFSNIRTLLNKRMCVNSHSTL